jgi:CRISPR-associated protein Cas2
MADPVWLMVMFDLPVRTKEQRRGANRYRNMLYDQGFSQIQFSVYAKYLINASGVRGLLPHLRQAIPVDGEVRVLRLTDEQWSSTYRYFGDREVSPEERPSQLELFLPKEKMDEDQLLILGRNRTGVKTKTKKPLETQAEEGSQATKP